MGGLVQQPVSDNKVSYMMIFKIAKDTQTELYLASGENETDGFAILARPGQTTQSQLVPARSTTPGRKRRDFCQAPGSSPLPGPSPTQTARAWPRRI